MKSLSEVKTVSDFLERAADIAETQVTGIKWATTSPAHVLSAMTHAAYPAADSQSEHNTAAWWPDHLRIRAMDKDAQSAVKRVTGWDRIVGNDRFMDHVKVVEVLREAAEACAS